MKKKPLKIEELRVKSFVCMNKETQKTVAGGAVAGTHYYFCDPSSGQELCTIIDVR